MQIYQSPGGPVIGTLRAGQRLTVFYNQQIYQGLTWIEVQDEEGRNGWVPQLYLHLITETPTITPSLGTVPAETPAP
jgi:hypothetical protein